MAEFQLLFHEVAGITIFLILLTITGVMAHLEATAIQHDLHGLNGERFDVSVSKLPDFILQRENPCNVMVVG